MNYYETVIIFKETTEESIIPNYTEIIQSYSTNTKIYVEDLGIKNLAYEIKSNKRGRYVKINWQGYNADTLELQKILKADSNVLKFITILLSDKPAEQKPLVDLLDIIYNLK